MLGFLQQRGLMMKWLKKYFRPVNKKDVLREISDHVLLIEKADEALKRYEKAALDGEDHWLECELVEVKFKKGEKNGTLAGSAHINCHS